MAQQLILSVEDTSTLKALKKLVSVMNGVTILPQKKVRKAAFQPYESLESYEPNAVTLQAMKDARSGRTYRASSAANLISEVI
ncbi:MAG: hypothetical protein LUD17_16500 [Bacteroidales bacterium]|nr:hypothetical protein [Bacteroidales bacterium]